MKRKKILAWLLTLCLIIGMLPGVTLPAAAAGGKTVYVGGSGEGHYATLQEAYAALGGQPVRSCSPEIPSSLSL